jgi:thiazole/oxazole-forming peptide maturase SagD family component
MLDLQPMVICNHKYSDQQLIFYVGKEIIEQPCYTDQILAVVGQMNNINTVADIISSLEGRVQASEVLEIVQWLLSENIIVDVRQTYTLQHRLSQFPDLFPCNLSLIKTSEVLQTPASVNAVELPIPKSNLLDIMSQRKSTRNFCTKSLSPELITGLLLAMSKVKGNRVYASAGGMYPVKLYLHIFQSESIPPGTYLFEPDNVSLLSQSCLKLEILKYALDNEFDLETASLIFVAADLSVHTQKYSNRGYNYTLMDVGACCAGAYLFAAENNFGICQYGGFDSLILKEKLLLPQNQEVMAVLRFGVEGQHSDPIHRVNKQIVYLQEKLSSQTGLKVNTRPLEFNYQRMGYWATSTQFNLSNGDIAGGNGVAYSATMSQLKSLAEILERLESGSYKVDVRCPALDLDNWLDPRIEFPLHPEFREKYNLKKFEVTQIQDWVMGTRLKSGQKVYVPTDCVFYPMPADYQICMGITSNGVAAGQTLESAISTALMELIERDAIMVSWYSQQPLKKIAQCLLDDYLLDKVVYWQSQQRQLEFFDFTLDTIPVVVATISGADYPMFVKGSSANPDFLKACHKALQEVEITTHSLVHSHRLLPIKPEEVIEVDDHGRLYYFSQYQEHLWQFKQALVSKQIPTVKDKFYNLDPIVIVLHQPDAEQDLWVVRVIDEQFLQITFGFATEHYNHHRLPDLGLKWALPYPAMPHYIA